MRIIPKYVLKDMKKLHKEVLALGLTTCKPTRIGMCSMYYIDTAICVDYKGLEVEFWKEDFIVIRIRSNTCDSWKSWIAEVNENFRKHLKGSEE